MNFSADTQEWLNGEPYIEYGKRFLGNGISGDVYEVDNYKDLVIKVPRHFLPLIGNEDIDSLTFIPREFIKSEWDNYKRLKDTGLVIPMSLYNLGVKASFGYSYTGLIKPKVTTDYLSLRKVSDRQLTELRDKLKALSAEGYKISGRLQAGISEDGTLLLYDLGSESLRPCYPGEDAYKLNNYTWRSFLKSLGRRLTDLGDVEPGHSRRSESTPLIEI